MRALILVVAVLALIAGCESKTQQVPPSAEQVVAPKPEVALSTSSPSQWIGEWQGPEGTLIEIAQDGEAFLITITNLDGPRTFQGHASGDRLLFERDGQSEAIRFGTGAQTGMKWLAEKRECLVVKQGEGYCRA